MINKTLGNIFKGDKVIWMVFFFLCLISVVEVFSASSSLTYKSGSYLAPMLKHLGILVVGIFCMVVTLNIKCRYFKIVTPVLLIVSFGMLIWVLLFGSSTNDANRWISILGIQFQPSEIAKGAMVLATAQILSAMQTPNGADKHAIQYILIVGAFLIFPILLENFSTAVLLCAVILMMMIIGRVPASQIGKLLGVVMLMAVLFFSAIMMLGEDKQPKNSNLQMTETAVAEQTKGNNPPRIFHRFDTWKSRINKFLNSKEVAPEDIDLDKDAQVAHANIAIASSNGIGKGPGNSVERDFLSQAFSDFIYAIIIEETGIMGAAFVAFLYITLLFRTGRIANRCENNFPAFLAMGLALLLVSQAMFNMAVAVGLAPVTGQPLPLVSKGGTSSIINCIYVGVILSISRSAKKKKTANDGADEMKLATSNA
ncbi:FtsW/RodA/SpoVE family cell cycle protein [Prevotella sp. KH2C16]|uniref:FtsW/RodA/SpoVE family cell cycle protein n=1 Tax=Prevotella sp. KH2C16 TaxID=1855325 RepID=UPI0008DFFD3F|nr:FtsW/RodA/SpoVE family cell cycle protein [Prevotella sp. KH2C16]SFG04860.1 cell division protein FtsW [Prevotella sp. KH2C16]